jgi:hypothetical protein
MSPTHIEFIGVKKNWLKISHLGTFKKQKKPFWNMLNICIILLLYFPCV